MFEFRKPIQISDALSKIMAYAKKGEKEIISIEECDNRILAEPILAKHPIPPFDKAPYDGFAIRSKDTITASTENPIEFEVIEHIGAGHLATKSVNQNKAIRIMTGAQLPDGADCVAMFEVTQSYTKGNKSYMSIKRRLNEGDNVSYRGAETEEGTILVDEGTKINPGIKALLATFGYQQVTVAKAPKVGFFATGTELLDIHEPLTPGKIRNSNTYMISAQITRAGGIPIYFGKLVDEFDICFQAISKALDTVDILITTGGVSVGDFDLMPKIYEELGAEILFNKIAMRPGSVTTVAVLGDKLLFGLSGNPSACYVGFELFARPIIKVAQHSTRPFPPKIEATLAADFPKANPFTRFVRSYIEFKDGLVYVYPSGMDKSAVVTSLAGTNALMVLPGGSRGFKSGAKVEVLLLETYEGDSSI